MKDLKLKKAKSCNQILQLKNKRNARLKCGLTADNTDEKGRILNNMNSYLKNLCV
jgi:hypothetical protein